MSDPWHGGKGDKRRPRNEETYAAGYDMTFGKTPEIREAARKRWQELRESSKKPLDIVEEYDTLDEDDETPSFYYPGGVRPTGRPHASD